MSKRIANNFFKSFTSLKWGVWLFPLFAVLISAWLLIGYFAKRGPLITIHFEDASSVEAQKTPLIYRGITVGRVDSVKLAENTQEVIVKARLNRDAKDLAVEGSKFWIVVPQVDFAGVSGLETIFKGPYIRIEPGKGAAEFEFQGNTGNEIKDPKEGTISYFLTTAVADPISVGDSVTYRGVKIGAVTSVTLGTGGKTVVVQINVERDSVRYIRTNTLFWRKNAVDADLGLFGSKIKVGSLESILKGGVALATPNDAGEIANAESTFKLEDDPPEKWLEWAPKL